jgi:hypothetical protein
VREHSDDGYGIARAKSSQRFKYGPAYRLNVGQHRSDQSAERRRRNLAYCFYGAATHVGVVVVQSAEELAVYVVPLGQDSQRPDGVGTHRCIRVVDELKRDRYGFGGAQGPERPHRSPARICVWIGLPANKGRHGLADAQIRQRPCGRLPNAWDLLGQAIEQCASQFVCLKSRYCDCGGPSFIKDHG